MGAIPDTIRGAFPDTSVVKWPFGVSGIGILGVVLAVFYVRLYNMPIASSLYILAHLWAFGVEENILENKKT